MENWVLILIIVLVFAIFIAPKQETFSDSGLAISNRYCQKLTDVYYKPRVNKQKCRFNYRRRICGQQRRNTIDPRTGNYVMDYGVLV